METDRGLRPRGVEADGRGARPAGPRTSPRSTAARASRFVELGVVLEEMGRVAAVRPVLLDRRARRQRDPATPATTRKKAAACPASRRARRSPRSRSPSRTGKWDAAGITLEATKSRRRLHARRHEDVRARRPHRRPDRRRRAHAGTTGDRRHLVLHGRRRRRRASPARRSRRWTRPASRPSSSSPTSPATLARRPTAPAGPRSRRRSTRPRSALAAEQVGGAQKVLEMSVEYAKVRVQFGRPIGSFQAIKHKCADMLLEVESAKSAAYYAGWAAAEDNDELPVGGRAWPRRTAPRRTSTPPPRTSRSTAASASPGSTPRTCTSSGRRAPRCSSATRRTTASCSPSASASDRHHSVAHCEPGSRLAIVRSLASGSARLRRRDEADSSAVSVR